MTGARALTTATLVRLGEVANWNFVLPLAVFYPTSRCNSRCRSCDWWQRSGDDDLSAGEVDDVAEALSALGTRVVVFSGGEPLLRPDAMDLADRFRRRGMALHLLTSGLLLDRFAERVGQTFERVCISLDAASEDLYEAVRGVRGLAVVRRGVARLRAVAPQVQLTARATLHRSNFQELPRLVDLAHAMGVDGISFLPADVSSMAFGRRERPDPRPLELTGTEIAVFAELVERTIAVYAADIASGFIAESPEKLRRLPQYFAALDGSAAFPPVDCNAPWVSIVIEADGSVRPCFFHEPIGNVRRTPLETIVARDLPRFRAAFDPRRDPVCRRCVCSLRTGWRHAPWH